MGNLVEWYTKVNMLMGELKVRKQEQESIEEVVKGMESHIEGMVMARNILSEASRATQEQFKAYVEGLVTLAIQSVFPNENYKFVVDFVLQNNRSNINLLVQQGDKDPYIPEDEQGGGLLDIISFALRIVLWSLEKPRRRNVIIMDEPFRWTGNLTEKAADMMKEISEKLGIQIIIVTHDDRLKEIADKSWMVQRTDGSPSTISECTLQQGRQEDL